ncbi:MAG: bifunctional UDP-N-acetylglucosamine diphosphorylase/glucosamine-1-phosphate N-acetyltransferase GlmU [SAR202 cluster bacterium]|nr:bifunctional UDP-N-acetylglucosamine diphosphorylase/glucosamine-1-phosphate N-acetyltransferase GlmU [SAR202 cluster bacterium]
MKSRASVILAAGTGTRMKSRIPKVLHRVCGKEMVSLVIQSAEDAGLGPTYLVVPPNSDPFFKVFGKTVTYVEQTHQLGSGHALLQTQDALNGVANVAVLSGDVPLIRPETLTELMHAHMESEASITILTSTVSDPGDLGRILRDDKGQIIKVIEEIDTDQNTETIKEVNSGIYVFNTTWLWENIQNLRPSNNGEFFVTDLIEMASEQNSKIASHKTSESKEVLGVNNRVQLAESASILQRRIRERHMVDGVTMSDPETVYIDHDVEIRGDTVIHPNTHIGGATTIGESCEIGPNTKIESSVIGNECKIVSSNLENSTLENNVHVGPFSHIRQQSHLGTGVYIGTSVEIKKSHLGSGTKTNHFSYIGDADIGANVNIGAGSITCNYDGKSKNTTVIEEGAFIGCDTMMIAPVTIGARSITGAGTVVTKDIPPDTMAKGVPARHEAID